MGGHDLESRMWTEAIEMLERAEQIRRQFFYPARDSHVGWEPPVDVYELDRTFVVIVAIPDVDPKLVNVAFRNGLLHVDGERRLPGMRSGTFIRRLEIPQGKFERRIRLPVQTLDRKEFRNGCLYLTLSKGM